MGVGLALAAAAAFAASGALVLGADAPADKAKKAEVKTEKAPPAKPAQKKLTGQELYTIHCNRCHAERYPTEWNPAQWRTLMRHMRVRANLPAKTAKEILKYLKEDAGN